MQEIGLRDGRSADRGNKVGNTCEQKYRIQNTNTNTNANTNNNEIVYRLQIGLKHR